MIKVCRFFGCWSPDKKGHFLYQPDGRMPYGREDTILADLFEVKSFDMTLCPDTNTQTQGHAALVQALNWTSLAWWDRTGDPRWNSNSALLCRGAFTFDEMLALGREHFSEIMARQTVPLELVVTL